MFMLKEEVDPLTGQVNGREMPDKNLYGKYIYINWCKWSTNS